ncbi:MAG: Asp-tRNA(Asn)/Glu-tRNA(Gln) amidotransferase subunit GatB [Patescibacteria group bacterium]
MLNKFKSTIGLEIHAELKTKTKMFCACLNDSDEKHPNINVCPICMGHPGTLPVPNKKAVESVILTGKSLNCEMAEIIQFDRKNYFYPDLPKGYQISQFWKPLCQNGFFEIGGKKIRIKEIHIEEDTGRLYHPQNVDYSLVDFNRAGAPLMELVTEPDISSGAEAKKFCEEIQLIFRYLGISDADMEKGQMRCEVNISLSKNKKLGTKAEIKNLNSFKAVEKSIDYEIERQAEILEKGEKIAQETRGWDADKQKTFSQRAKETAKDYRYFPEPDIPLSKISNLPPKADQPRADKSRISNLPELPQKRRKRFALEYGLPEENIEIFVVNKELGDYFEQVISEIQAWDKNAHKVRIENLSEHTARLIKLSANYLITELQKLAREFGIEDYGEIKISPENFAELIILTHKGDISSSGAQEVLREMVKTGNDPSQIIEERGMGQESDIEALTEIVKTVIKNNFKAVEDYKKKQGASLQFLIGQVMRETKGKANPQIAADLLKEIIG